MRIGGLQKNTALDFPGLFAALIFTQGCNFCCPYCHNPELVRLFGEPLAEEEVLVFLNLRRGLLDGVVISGGEPTLQADLFRFTSKLKGLGYAVKIDTNGSRPDIIAELIARKLIDYVALDIKADPRHYPKTLCPQDLGTAIMDSINLLKRSPVHYEFRITAAAPFINDESMEAIAQALQGPDHPVFLQSLRRDKNLNPAFLDQYSQPGPQELTRYLHLLQRFAPYSAIR